jgi:hypothetical protein
MVTYVVAAAPRYHALHVMLLLQQHTPCCESVITTSSVLQPSQAATAHTAQSIDSLSTRDAFGTK